MENPVYSLGLGIRNIYVKSRKNRRNRKIDRYTLPNTRPKAETSLCSPNRRQEIFVSSL